MRPYIIVFIMVCMVVIYLLARRFRQQRVQQQAKYEQHRRDNLRPEDNFNTIFVVIPCYRDEHACAETLFSLFNDASCPWRLRVAVMHHVHPSENHYAMDIINLYEHVVLRHNATSFQPQIKIISESSERAMGPWDARSRLINTMFQNERFVLTLSCHSQLVRDWDSKCLDQYALTLRFSPRPILTTYPALLDLEQPLENHATYPVVSQQGDLVAAVYNRIPVRPFPTFVVSPSFMFCSSRLITECPWNVSLPYLSNKDALMVTSARYYTHGWDFYTPTEPILYRTISKPIMRTDARIQREKQVARVNGLMNHFQCRICEDDRENHDDFTGHPFESWPREHVFGGMRTIEEYLKFAQKGYLGLSADVTAEEQVAKFDRVLYA